MYSKRILALLKELEEGNTTAEEALERLRVLPFEDVGYARIDHHRELRSGFPEVIFCPGKRPQQVAEIVYRLAQEGSNVLATRAGKEVFQAVSRLCPHASYHEIAQVVEVRQYEVKERGRVLILTAGTADQGVAEEAAVTARAMGCGVELICDVGVAGLHRLLAVLPQLREAEVIIVVAGMEGALASVVGGLTDKPVIAVPTSVGYGSSFKGLAALLAMLNSCAPGMSVVNIDNGFGAAAMAAAIIRQIYKE